MTMTANEIRRVGIEALIKALGPVGMSRFLQQFEPGRGDYTKERHQWLDGITMEDALRELKQLESAYEQKNESGPATG